ncbi:hypothetical protein LJB42_004284 [Komagataella kurtzmanii]|nr:hypothetical protein LJB42_004284 [Komagataella kurtzmanii]
MRDLIVLSGSSNPQLTARICKQLGVPKGEVISTKFANGETSVTVVDSVREKDVYIVQSGCGHTNDNFFELLIMISACKTASAKRVTAVLPLFPYSRQPDLPYNKNGYSVNGKREFDSSPGTPIPNSTASESTDYLTSSVVKDISNHMRKSTLINQPVPTPTASSSSSLLNNNNTDDSPTYKEWIAQSGTLVANLLTTAGADHIITMDLHDPQFQGFFDIPVDNLYSKPLLQHYIANNIPDFQNAVVVSPDSGGAKRAIAVADQLGMSFALIHKERRYRKLINPTTLDQSLLISSTITPSNGNKVIATTMLVGDVAGKVCVLIDDLVDTSYTITRAASLLKDQGATYVYALVTHGVFSGDAINRINDSAIDKIITTTSTPQDGHAKQLGTKLEVLDVSRILAEAIRRINNGESVSMLFEHGW